jgi:glycosyltransferase involved in cell wall biosynthesis
MRSVLMVAFHYPPCAGSSGIQRTLNFSRHLGRHDWRPIVLSAQPRAYDRTNDQSLSLIPDGITVERAFSLNSTRHFAVRGVYPRLLSLPDPWVTWWLGAVPRGLRLIRTHRPAAIWSTFPIATAHLIGLTLHRLTGLPWIADFRDPMTEADFPSHGPTRRLYRLIEDRIARHAARLVFTTESSLKLYRERYPEVPDERWVLIPNGYDEDDFRDLVSRTASTAAGAPLRLVHSGLVYPEERDPRPFFQALARLVKDGYLPPDSLRVELRGCGTVPYYAEILHQLHLEDLVQLLGPLPYREALCDCATASALLLLQGPSCNRQIPAKTYEYLRLRKPILALTDAAGDTASLLRSTGGATMIDLLDEDALYREIPIFMARVRSGVHQLPDPAATRRYARHNQAQELAQCLDAVA